MPPQITVTPGWLPSGMKLRLNWSCRGRPAQAAAIARSNLRIVDKRPSSFPETQPGPLAA
jgi:hypothetical protein